MSNKIGIALLSDPKHGGDEALGRLFNGLAAAYESKTQGDDVTIYFLGTGTRWLAELTKSDHPAHGLFAQVKENVAGASCACAQLFGAADDVRDSGFPLLEDLQLPGVGGVSSLRSLHKEGRQILSF